MRRLNVSYYILLAWSVFLPKYSIHCRQTFIRRI